MPGTAARYCYPHREASRKHGHPLQERITIRLVRPLEKEVAGFIRKYMPKGKREELLRVIAASHRDFQGMLEAIASGRLPESRNRFLREAAEKLHRLFRDATPEDLYLRLCAVFLLEQRSPHLFRDDTAFQYQLVTLARRLAGISDGTWWDNKRAQVRHVTRRIPHNTMRAMWNLLKEYASIRVGPFLLSMKQKDALEQDRKALMWSLYGSTREQIAAERVVIRRLLDAARRKAREALEQAAPA